MTDEETTSAVPQGLRGIVFTTSFAAHEPFTVVDHLEQRATVDLLQIDGESVAELSSPDDWTGHVIRYAARNGVTGVTTLLFLERERLTTGTVAQFSVEASVYSPELNVLEAPVDSVEVPDPEEPIGESDG